MFANQSKKRNVRFIRPPNTVKQKVGSGGIDVDKINKAETLIGESAHLFIPFATDVLKNLRTLIDEFSTRQADGEDYIEDIIHPIMDLKANGAMMGYPMVSHITGITLQFLEVISTMNKDAIQIIDVSYRALSLIILKDMKGYDKAISSQLRKELNQACERYFEKHDADKDVEHVDLSAEIDS